MISPKDVDMNRSKDVPGPQLTRNYDKEMKMEKLSGDATNVIEKCPLSSLHDGDQEVPLMAAGKQDVVVSMPMGSDMPDNKPMVAKGSTKDEQHYGKK